MPQQSNLLNMPDLSQAANSDLQMPNCPDAAGILRGTIRVNAVDAKNGLAGQVSSVNGLTVEAKITGYVNDAAELTHFDVTGTAVEGAATRATFAVEESRIGNAAPQGRTMITVAQNLDAGSGNRIEQVTRSTAKTIIEQAAAKLSTAREQWRSGACVELKLTAPKTRLSAGEKIVVSAENRHKLEKILVPAKLVVKEASASATPTEQANVPLARFTLTAPQNGNKAMISVESVSKRGIGLGKLEFEANAIVARKPVVGKTTPPKTPPIKKAACNAGWSGKITVEKRLKKETIKPESGRLLRDINRKDEILNLEYTVTGIQDTAGGFVNGFFADTQMSFRSLNYQENFYGAGKTSCDKKIISTTELRTMEIAMTASGSKRTTVYISPWGEKGILTLKSPEINAERIITRKYETACPSYDQVNSSVEKGDRLIEIVAPSFEIHFELDSKSNSQLVGSKTIQESDGSEIIVHWNLTRDCK
jgi:hypothetical protein